ncbi:nuclear transport factor 2 family protein [Nocardia cyriacigeorgica]|nr:nuclear transport factor 2 family protein [Nocardia cyriacigeorgica]
MDRLDVIDTCTRMVWHTDHREWDELAAVFHDSVRLDYTSLNGGEPVTMTPAQIVAAWRETLGGFDATQHLLGNHLVTVDGDSAVCTASFRPPTAAPTHSALRCGPSAAATASTWHASAPPGRSAAW